MWTTRLAGHTTQSIIPNLGDNGTESRKFEIANAHSIQIFNTDWRVMELILPDLPNVDIPVMKEAVGAAITQEDPQLFDVDNSQMVIDDSVNIALKSSLEIANSNSGKATYQEDPKLSITFCRLLRDTLGLNAQRPKERRK